MSTIPRRIVIYPRDVANITGRCERTARRLLEVIRKKNNKGKGGFVTVREFCEYTGLEVEEVRGFLV